MNNTTPKYLKTNNMTAVELLVRQLFGAKRINIEEAIEKVKEMEKQQIIQAYCNGCKNPLLNKTHEEKAEQYYTETFKNK